MKKGSLINVIFILAIALILFSPLGFHLKVWVNRVISFNPTSIEESEQQVLLSYDWALQDRQGKIINLDQARGKVIFINLWASWCPPCVAEMPSLQALYDDYQNEVEFYFIARDEKEKIDAFMEKHQYSFPVHYEITHAPAKLKSNSLPTTFIIDRSGSLIVNHTGAARWNGSGSRSILDELISSEDLGSTPEEKEKVSKE